MLLMDSAICYLRTCKYWFKFKPKLFSTALKLHLIFFSKNETLIEMCKINVIWFCLKLLFAFKML
jgi:hypothetical protein